MNFIDAIVLGLVQGLTEFIPVSSSGHLVIASHLLGVNDAFTFDVLLNFGTLLALVVFYRVRIWSLIKRVITGKDWKLFGQLIAATIPAAAIGVLFTSQIERLNNMLWVVIFMLVSIGIVMIVAGKAKPNADDRELEKSVTWPIAIKVGLIQSLALIPGSSRSGLTILMGLYNNLSAKKAAEFSFLLAIPVLAGGSLMMLVSHKGQAFLQDNLSMVLIGNLVSFVSGMLAITFMIKLLSKRGLKDFGWYRIGLGSLLAILLITGIIN